MNKLVFIILMGLPLTCFSKEPASIEADMLPGGINKIIASVNGDVITLRDLQEFKRSSSIDKSAGISGQQALENLIEEKLIIQLARKEKFDADKLWVDKRIKQLISTYGGYDKFEESLVKAGLNTAIIRKKIGDNFLIRKAVDKHVGSRISVSPMEITEYYKKHIKEFSSLPRYICWITKSGKKDFLEKLSMKIKEEGFDKVLASKKDAFFKIESDEKGLNDKVKEIIKSIKEGQWKIKEIEGAYYLVYLIKIVPAHKAFINEVRDKIYKRLWREKFSRRFESWVSELKEKSVIRIYPVK